MFKDVQRVIIIIMELIIKLWRCVGGLGWWQLTLISTLGGGGLLLLQDILIFLITG